MYRHLRTKLHTTSRIFSPLPGNRRQRVFVLEYKGEHLITADEAKEKSNIGQLWAAKSDGKGVFLMARERDERGRSLKDQIAAALV